jgi:type II secretory pathway component GspD/PulD (secretin)
MASRTLVLSVASLLLAASALLLSPVSLAQAPVASQSLPNPALPPADKATGKVPTRVEFSEYRMQNERIQTFYLANAPAPNDQDEILTGLRLMLDPGIKLYLIAGQNAIAVNALPDELALAGKLIADWDHPRRAYRLTYTVTESDGGQRVGMQHFTLDVVSGERSTLKNGSKVPVMTGSYNADGSKGPAGVQTQFTYLDIGISIDATLTGTAGGGLLKSSIEQSSIAPDKGIYDEPVIRQAKLEGIYSVPLGRAVPLGSIDVAGSTRHLDIEVQLDPAR